MEVLKKIWRSQFSVCVYWQSSSQAVIRFCLFLSGSQNITNVCISILLSYGDFYFLCVCVHVSVCKRKNACARMCAEAGRKHQISWSWCFRCLWATRQGQWDLNSSPHNWTAIHLSMPPSTIYYLTVFEYFLCVKPHTRALGNCREHSKNLCLQKTET